MEFKKGDQVRLISGGPSMTINSDLNEDGQYECVWFEKNEPKYHEFDKEVLKNDGLPKSITLSR